LNRIRHFVSIFSKNSKLRRLDDKKRKAWLHAVATVPFFVLAILFHLLELAANGCWAIGWFWYLSFAISVTR
jgi:hypothetical protein